MTFIGYGTESRSLYHTLGAAAARDNSLREAERAEAMGEHNSTMTETARILRMNIRDKHLADAIAYDEMVRR